LPRFGSADMAAVTYDVMHATRYTYSNAVSVSHHLARLSPRRSECQACLTHDLRVEPEPAVRASHTDYFGNHVTFFAMQAPHTALAVEARSRVRVTSPPAVDPTTPPWERAADRLRLPLDAVDALFDSTSIHARPEYAAYARESFAPRRPLLEAVVDLTSRIHHDFTFDPEATTVTTPLAEVFRLRRGVCQDFARFEIACLRSLGLPAMYVSGYLETVPPPGMPRLIGADASHAWLAVYCPDAGWIEVDPTNNLVPSTGHVALARGLDYHDISPIRGVILGGGQHTLHVSVDVVRVEDETAEQEQPLR
jgi:transglutaminase-like putative cysteine protease